jgi:hypothetical protein
LPSGVPVTVSASDADGTDTFNLWQVFAFIPNGTTLTYSWSV